MFEPLFTCFLQECNRDTITQLAEDMSSLTLSYSASDGQTAEVQCKLTELVKTRNVMKFISHPNGNGQSSSPFAPEEISLLQNIPKGTCQLFVECKG